MTSIIEEQHRTEHHTKNERCNAPYKLCDDSNCILKGKHYVCSDHEFHPGDRIVNWEFKNKYGWIYYTRPNIISINQVVYIKYDNDNNKIHARFGKCACADVFIKTDESRDLTKSHISTKYTKMFPLV